MGEDEATTNQILALAERTVKQYPADKFLKGVERADELRQVLEDLFAMQAALPSSVRKRMRKGRLCVLESDKLTGEQIWQTLLQWQQPLTTWLEGMCDNLADFDVRLLQGDDDDDDDDEAEEAADRDFDEDADLDEDDDEDVDDDDEEGFFDGVDDDDEDEEDAPVRRPSAVASKPLADPLLDDELFRVSEMDAFADKMELRMMKDRDDEDKEDEEDEDDDDDDNDMDSYDSQDEELADKKFIRNALFQADNDDDYDEEGGAEEDLNARFDDFFGPPSSTASSLKLPAAATASGKPSKRDAARLELQQRIKQLEDEAMSDKPWETKGEIKASSRPKDSLLDKQDVLDVDFLKRTTPALTPEVARDIEAYILKRVLEGKFDDREEYVRPEEGDGRASGADATVLSKERSKEGLAATYAREYEEQVLHHKPKAQQELEKDQADVKQMFEALCQKLDSLSNLVFTPKPPPSHKNSASNRPADIGAIHMEDIVPTTEAGGLVSQTAPEELQRRAVGLGKSAQELDPQDRRALRRRNKERAKKRQGPATIVPQRVKKVRATEASTSNRGDMGATDWTSSAQVFRRIEQQTAAGGSGGKKQ